MKMLTPFFSAMMITTFSMAQKHVGINTTNPLAALHVADSSVLFSASGDVPATAGDVPVSGAGRRMMWYADKAAFRAGYVTGINWNKDSIGLYSFAAGQNTKAKGNYSAVFGQLTGATGLNSFASGVASTASGDYSIAMGNSNIASGLSSFATGALTTAPGNYASSFGKYTKAQGYASTAIGDSTTAPGSRALAIGYQTTASGENAMATGFLTTASGANAASFGTFTNASGSNAMSMGQHTIATGQNTLAIGSESTASGDNSIVMGVGNASTANSVVIGTSSKTRGAYAIALGSFAFADGLGSIAIGSNDQSGLFPTTAGGDYSVAIGNESVATANYSTAIGVNAIASGFGAVALGFNSTASGINSTAIGNSANTNFHSYSCSINGGNGHANTEDHQMMMDFQNYTFWISPGNYAYLIPASNGWAYISDRNKKERFEELNGETVLQKISAIPFYSWNFKEASTRQYRHYGIMAQDFYDAFGKDSYGKIGNDTTVSPLDMLGVDMAAIKALEKRSQLLSKENETLKMTVTQLQLELAETKIQLRDKMQLIETMLNDLLQVKQITATAK
jgi:hypothetical protein